MKLRGHLAFTVFAILASADIARADGSDLEGLLGESVVTTASNAAETSRDAPATTTVITAESIRKYGARSLAEAMDLLGLGTMSAQGVGAGEMGARGVMIDNSNGEHFLLLVNGQRANDVLHGTATFGRVSGIPLEIVDHIEVILGPGSVLYGSNAMLGVVNVVTKAAKDFSGARVGTEADLLTSVRPWAGYGGTFKLFEVDGEATFELEYYKQWGPSLYFEPVYGGVDFNTGKLTRYTSALQGTGIWGGASSTQASQFEAPSALGRVRLGKFDLSVNGTVATSPTGSAPSDFGAGAAVNQTRRLLLNLGYDNQLTPVIAMKAHAYVNLGDDRALYTISRAPECTVAGITCQLDVRGEGLLRGIEIAPSFDWLKNGNLVTLIGTDAEWRTGESLVNTYNAASSVPVTNSTGLFDQTNIALAGYVQQSWKVTPWLGLNGGARLDWDERFAPDVSPRLALRVDPWKGGTVKVIYSQAFRAPSLYESYFSYPTAPVAQGLAPERERSVEASIEERFNTHRILFGGFVTAWSNLIEYFQFTPAEALQYVQEGKAVLPPQYQYRNLTSVRNMGFNASFEGTQFRRKLEYGFNLTAAMAWEQEPSQEATPLDVSPTLFGNARVSYELPGPWPTVAFAVSGQSKRPVENAFASSFHPVPFAPPMAVLRATLSGAIAPVRGLSYRLTAFYATADREPFIAGPAIDRSANYTTPALMPIDRARATLGLQYEF